MKKILLTLALVGAVAFAFGFAGHVFAQTELPPAVQPGYGPGMMGGYGQRGGGRMAGYTGTDFGPMHDDMVGALADKLGMTVDEVNARLAAGDSMYTLASEKGLTVEDFRGLMDEIHDKALDKAVAAGTITQEQADFMENRGAGMMGGFGRNGNFGGCPFYDQDND